MKSSKTEIHAKFHKIPRIRFSEERKLTSYSGIVIFQALFNSLKLGARIRACFRHLGGNKIGWRSRRTTTWSHDLGKIGLIVF